MSLHHSEETHRQLVERLQSVTGKDLPEWVSALENGPSLLRFDEKVNWLRDEFNIAHGHATAIVHEYDKKRAARKLM
jgi:Domain of unknown function (DUF4287)